MRGSFYSKSYNLTLKHENNVSILTCSPSSGYLYSEEFDFLNKICGDLNRSDWCVRAVTNFNISGYNMVTECSLWIFYASKTLLGIRLLLLYLCVCAARSLVSLLTFIIFWFSVKQSDTFYCLYYYYAMPRMDLD